MYYLTLNLALESTSESTLKDFLKLAKIAGFSEERIKTFEEELKEKQAFVTIAYAVENEDNFPVGFYISRRVDKMPFEKRDERFHKRMEAVRKRIPSISEKSDDELASMIADSGNSFVLEEYRGKGIGKNLYGLHEKHAKELGYQYKFEAARAIDEEGDAQRILLKLGYISLGKLGYCGQRYNKELYGFIKKLDKTD